jgi:hypothetical protein
MIRRNRSAVDELRDDGTDVLPKAGKALVLR